MRLSSVLRVATGAIAAAAFAASTATAAAPWSAPAATQGAPPSTPALAFNAPGLGVLATDTGGGATPDAVGPHTVAALTDETGAFPGPMTAMTATNFALADRFALYGLSRIAGIGTHFSRARSRAGLVLGTAGDKLTDVRSVGPTDRAGTAEAIAANQSGDVAASFGVCSNDACVHQSLYLVVRRRGDSPLPSIRVDNVAVRQISTVAINARGDMLDRLAGQRRRLRPHPHGRRDALQDRAPRQPRRAGPRDLRRADGRPGRGRRVGGAVRERGHARLGRDRRRDVQGGGREPPLPLLPAPGRRCPRWRPVITSAPAP